MESRDAVEIHTALDALRNTTVVKFVNVEFHSVQLDEEALVKLSEVMKCNESVESLGIELQGGLLLRERLFATMATRGGCSSVKRLYLYYRRASGRN